MQDIEAKILPADVRLEGRHAGLIEELLAHLVQAGNEGIATAGYVGRPQIKRQANEVVAQGPRDPFVDSVTDLLRPTDRNLAGDHMVERRRVEERLYEAHRIVQAIGDAVGIEALHGHGIGQHRMTEAIDGMGELGRDRRVDGDVVAGKCVHVRAELAGKLTEHEMLVLHRGDQLGRLEVHLGRPARRIGPQRNHDLDLLEHAVVFVVKHLMDARQRDVLVDPAIAPNKVAVEDGRVQQIALGVQARCKGIVRHVVEERMTNCHQDKVGGRQRILGSVLDEDDGAGRLVLGNQPGFAVGVTVGRAIRIQAYERDILDVIVAQRDPEIRCVRLDGGPGRHAAIGIADQSAGGVADGIVFPQEHRVALRGAVVLVEVDEGGDRVHALARRRGQDEVARTVDGRRHMRRGGLCVEGSRDLSHRQTGRDIDQRPIQHQSAGGRCCRCRRAGDDAESVPLRQAQQGDKRVGAAHAHRHGDRVGARHNHEIGLRPLDIERISRHQRDHDNAIGSLLHKAQAMVEELAEEGRNRRKGQRVRAQGQRRKPAAGRRGRIVLDLELGQRGRLEDRSAILIGNQIADLTRRGIDEVDVALGVAGRRPVDGEILVERPFGHERRRIMRQAREDLVRSAPRRVQNVVARARDVANTQRAQDGSERRIARIVIGQHQLFENEIEISLVKFDCHGNLRIN